MFDAAIHALTGSLRPLPREVGGVSLLTLHYIPLRWCLATVASYARKVPPACQDVDLGSKISLWQVRLSCQAVCDHDVKVRPLMTITSTRLDGPGNKPEPEITPPPEWIEKPAWRGRSGEDEHDLLREAPHRLGVVGDAGHVDDEVVDAGLNPGAQAFDDLLRGTDHELVGVLLVAATQGGADLFGGFLGIFATFEQVHVDGGGACDLLVVSPQVVAVAF